MRVAIIGTREPSADAARLCRRVAASFRNMSWELVTGNAGGIDGVARDVWNEKHPELDPARWRPQHPDGMAGSLRGARGPEP